MKVKFVTHDAVNNTLEVTWIVETLAADGTVEKVENVKCRSYSAAEVADFLADVTDGQKYATMAGW